MSNNHGPLGFSLSPLRPINHNPFPPDPVLAQIKSFTRTSETNARNANETAKLRATVAAARNAAASGAPLPSSIHSVLTKSPLRNIIRNSLMSNNVLNKNKTSKELWNQAAINANEKGVVGFNDNQGYTAGRKWRSNLIARQKPFRKNTVNRDERKSRKTRKTRKMNRRDH